jgi:flagellar hook-associated protein 3 FlgL
MEIAFTSTKSLNDGNRINVLKLQKQLLKAQRELASGRLSDVGATIGGRTSETVSLRLQYARFTTLRETNAVAKTRIDATQAALASFIESAQDFVSAVITARDANNGATIAQQQGQSALSQLLDGLNTTIAGEHLFSGINTTARPFDDYYATPTPASRTAVATAFTLAFGTTQSDPSNDGITPSAMQTFLDTGLSALFDDPAWTTDWSGASSQNLRSRISGTEDVESSANTNESPFRKLAKAFTMIADLGVENLNRAAFGTVADTAARIASEAIEEMTVVQGRLGTSAARIEGANERMSAQLNILNTQIDSLEQVDPFEASTRVTTLLTQIETAYALTARVQRLTILNYI